MSAVLSVYESVCQHVESLPPRSKIFDTLQIMGLYWDWITSETV